MAFEKSLAVVDAAVHDQPRERVVRLQTGQIDEGECSTK